MSVRLILVASVTLILLVVEFAQVLLHSLSELIQVIFIAFLILVLHVFLKDQLHLLGLFLDSLVAQAPLEQVPCLRDILLAVFGLHIHVNGPDVHPLRAGQGSSRRFPRTLSFHFQGFRA